MNMSEVAFVADRDGDFRESLVNHLLLLGLKHIIQVQTVADILRLLPTIPTAFVIIDCNLYRSSAVRIAVQQHQRRSGSALIVTVDDAAPTGSVNLLLDGETKCCVLKSSARQVLATLVPQSM